MTSDTPDARSDCDHLTLGAQHRFTHATKILMHAFSFPASLLTGGGYGLIISGCGLIIADTALGFALLGNPLPAILIGFALTLPGFYFSRVSTATPASPDGSLLVQKELG